MKQLLDPAMSGELERHLRDCDNCRMVVDTLRETISLYAVRLPFDQAPEKAVVALKAEGFGVKRPFAASCTAPGSRASVNATNLERG